MIGIAERNELKTYVRDGLMDLILIMTISSADNDDKRESLEFTFNILSLGSLVLFFFMHPMPDGDNNVNQPTSQPRCTTHHLVHTQAKRQKSIK